MGLSNPTGHASNIDTVAVSGVPTFIHIKLPLKKNKKLGGYLNPKKWHVEHKTRPTTGMVNPPHTGPCI